MDNMRLSNYLDLYISNASTKRVKGYGTLGLAYNTVRTYRSLKRIIKTYEKDSNTYLYLDSFDKNASEDLTRYLKLKKQYSDNYTGQLLKNLKVVLRDAEKSGFKIHPYSHYIEVFKQKSSDRIIITLTPDEIKPIKELKGLPSKIRDSHKWFIVGLFIGQRVSDLLSLTPMNIRRASGGVYVDIVQKKTKKAVTVGVSDPMVIRILTVDFPKMVTQGCFNRDIKRICKMAGIDEPINGYKNNPKRNRKEIILAPKYEHITSHVMRRSFASNYFGKIETPLLMGITGHTKETNFLTYIGTCQNKDALADIFMQKTAAIW
jgi:integrase